MTFMEILALGISTFALLLNLFAYFIQPKLLEKEQAKLNQESLLLEAELQLMKSEIEEIYSMDPFLNGEPSEKARKAAKEVVLRYLNKGK